MTEFPDSSPNGLRLLLESILDDLRQHYKTEGEYQIRLAQDVGGIKIDVAVLKSKQSGRAEWAKIVVACVVTAILAVIGGLVIMQFQK